MLKCFLTDILEVLCGRDAEVCRGLQHYTAPKVGFYQHTGFSPKGRI